MTLQSLFIYLIVCLTSVLFSIDSKSTSYLPYPGLHIIALYFKSLLTVVLSLLVLWLTVTFLLAPYNVAALFPFCALLISGAFSVALQKLLHIIFKFDITEFSLSFFAVLFAINDGISLVHTLVIGVTAVTAFYILAFFLWCLQRRNTSIKISKYFNKPALIFIAMACIIFALYGFEISWLNPSILNF
ncbi:MAG: hypothetical protein R3Y36_02670 [Spirochaetales bacterium]